MKAEIKHMGNLEHVSVRRDREQMSWERRVSMQGWSSSILLFQSVLSLLQKVSVYLISRKGICHISLTFLSRGHGG